MKKILSVMKHAKYAFIVGAILLAGAISMAAQTQLTTAQTGSGNPSWTTNSEENGTGKQFSESLANKTGGTTGNYTAGGNFTIGNQGFANGTTISDIGSSPVDTTKLKMHISEAKNAMQSNNTQGVMTNVIAALDEIEMILGGNATTTANATGITSMGNMTSIPNATSTMSNSTGR
jgi:hypothetical protein